MAIPSPSDYWKLDETSCEYRFSLSSLWPGSRVLSTLASSSTCQLKDRSFTPLPLLFSSLFYPFSPLFYPFLLSFLSFSPHLSLSLLFSVIYPLSSILCSSFFHPLFYPLFYPPFHLVTPSLSSFFNFILSFILPAYLSSFSFLSSILTSVQPLTRTHVIPSQFKIFVLSVNFVTHH
jgi:hypothetical protein